MSRLQSRFVSHFVDQMYVILIGLGIASIAFSLDLESHPFFHLLMSLFVTTVALIYWWDWKDYFENDVISSKSEFVVSSTSMPPRWSTRRRSGSTGCIRRGWCDAHRRDRLRRTCGACAAGMRVEAWESVSGT